MAENSFPFNEVVEGDRQHEASTFAKFLAGLRTRGVITGVGNALVVTESSPAALSVDVDTGGAFAGLTLEQRWYENTAILTKTIATADPTNPRIDTVVVEMDTASGVRDTFLAIVTGTPAGSPSPPTLVQTEIRYQDPLADVAVAALASTIVNANITDRRAFSAPNNIPGAGLQRVGGDTTERSTTSVTAVDLATITLDPDPVAGEIIRIVGKYRKGPGAAARAGLGLKLNSTVVVEAAATTGAMIFTGAADNAEHGVFEIEFAVGETNYNGGLRAAFVMWNATPAASVAAAHGTGIPTNNFPAAAIATLALRGIVANALNELFVNDVQVFRYATS